MALASKNDSKLCQKIDVATAFHNVELKEDVFMEQPEGFVVKGQKQLVCKLQKSLYDLKQSPRCWNEALHAQLLEMGFNQSL